MDKFSELKRLAEKSPVQRFEPFIGRAGGRGTQAIFNADTKGEVITWSGFDSSDVTSRTGREAIARFVAAVDPETVLALLAELEAKDQAHRVHAARLISDRGVLRERISELEAKLATPVRLPDSDIDSALIMAHWCSGEEVNAWVKGINYAKQQIRAAGFTVEGDDA